MRLGVADSLELHGVSPKQARRIEVAPNGLPAEPCRPPLQSLAAPTKNIATRACFPLNGFQKASIIKSLCLIYSRVQTVGPWMQDDFCWLSSLLGFGFGGRSCSNFLASTIMLSLKAGSCCESFTQRGGGFCLAAVCGSDDSWHANQAKPSCS